MDGPRRIRRVERSVTLPDVGRAADVPVGRTPTANPFTPGYGALPQVFAGRESEFRDLEVMAQRIRGGVYEQARHVVGVRGIGKTALLGEFAQWATDGGWWVVGADVAPATRILPLLAHRLGEVLTRHDPPGERAAHAALRALRLVSAFALRYGGADWHLEYRGAPVDADRGGLIGDPGADLQALLARTCTAARGAGTVLLDEVQNTPTADLGLLLYALQETQRSVHVERDPTSGREIRTAAPLGVVLAGLPSLPAAMRAASATFMSRSRAVRLEPLTESAIRAAIPAFTEPRGVVWDAAAIDLLVELTAGYPYFLHVYGYHTWLAGESPVIDEEQVRRGAATARPMLDAFYDERIETLTDRQRQLLVAVAGLPVEERTAARIAAALGFDRSSAIGSTLDRLLEHGLLLRTARGRYDLAVPGLDRHLRSRSS